MDGQRTYLNRAPLPALGVSATSSLCTGSRNYRLTVDPPGLALVGLLWVLLIFVLALMSAGKTERFQTLLGHALNDAESLSDEMAPPFIIRDWAQQTADLIEAAIGPRRGAAIPWGVGFGDAVQHRKDTRGTPVAAPAAHSTFPPDGSDAHAARRANNHAPRLAYQSNKPATSARVHT